MKSTSDNRLLEISLIVEDELVEPVAEVRDGTTTCQFAPSSDNEMENV